MSVLCNVRVMMRIQIIQNLEYIVTRSGTLVQYILPLGYRIVQII